MKKNINLGNYLVDVLLNLLNIECVRVYVAWNETFRCRNLLIWLINEPLTTQLPVCSRNIADLYFKCAQLNYLMVFRILNAVKYPIVFAVCAYINNICVYCPYFEWLLVCLQVDESSLSEQSVAQVTQTHTHTPSDKMVKFNVFIFLNVFFFYWFNILSNVCI